MKTFGTAGLLLAATALGMTGLAHAQHLEQLPQFDQQFDQFDRPEAPDLEQELQRLQREIELQERLRRQPQADLPDRDRQETPWEDRPIQREPDLAQEQREDLQRTERHVFRPRNAQERSVMEKLGLDPNTGDYPGFMAAEQSVRGNDDFDATTWSVDPLDTFPEQDLNRFANALDDGFDTALTYTVKAKKPSGDIQFMKNDELAAFDTEAYRALTGEFLGLPPEMRDRIQILPVRIGDRPIVQYPGSGGGQDGDPPQLRMIQSVGPGSEPGGIRVSSGSGNAVGAGVYDRTALTRDRSADPLPAAEDGNAAQRTDADGTHATEGPRTCGQGTGKSCFDPAVSLHDREGVACSGVLIHPRWVLSAAHCFCGPAPSRASIGQVTPGPHGVAVLDPAMINAKRPVETEVDTAIVTLTRFFFEDTAGTRKNQFCSKFAEWKDLTAPTQEQANIARNSITWDAEPEDPVRKWFRLTRETYRERDLALAKLHRPLSLSPPFEVAALGTRQIIESGAPLQVVGFGRNNWEPRGGHKTVLWHDIVSRYCDESIEQANTGCQRSIEMILQDTDGLSDTCHGDSGAGVYWVRGDGHLAVVGITSRGLPGGRCGTGGIYALTIDEAVRDWIHDIIPDLASNN